MDYWPGGGDGDAGGDFHSGKKKVTPAGVGLRFRILFSIIMPPLPGFVTDLGLGGVVVRLFVGDRESKVLLDVRLKSRCIESSAGPGDYPDLQP
ncbi:hypothetical protein [Pleomorphovibrio marinus]|uniref:hypothetical protein n=1 Tax=Pleomorphovibrio marinus TaxID=2164132 RepID=UPI000E0B9A0C|nr:hypothetical protein [Pleomorphovibrio marinus]